MNTVNFDYDAFFGDLQSPESVSNNPTLLRRSETDCDSGIVNTPPMTTGLEETIIDLNHIDICSWNVNNSLSNGVDDDFNHFSAFFDEKNDCLLAENSTFESLFADFDSREQIVEETFAETSSPSVPIPLSNTLTIPTITNCVKLQSLSNTPSLGTKYVKIEPMSINSNVKIVKTCQSMLLTNVPKRQMSLCKPDETISSVVSFVAPLAKRRRSDSPSNDEECRSVTLESLKVQYGHLNEETLRKHLRMIKNRESASLSRKRRKDLMDHLGAKVKDLTDENEQLKKHNSRLLTQIETLQLQNELLRKSRLTCGGTTSQSSRKPFILMGIVLLVVFNVFTLKSFSPVTNNSSSSIDLYNGEGAIVPSRAILGVAHPNNSFNTRQHDYESDGNTNDENNVRVYPYIQCVAYINKTHSKRINQDLHSWLQDHNQNQQENNRLQPKRIVHPKSLTLPSNAIRSTTIDSSSESQQHTSRKVALSQQRQIRISPNSKGQVQPYQSYETNSDDFLHTIDRRNDTLYFVSFKRDHLIFPAIVQNQTKRPKLSLILPASMDNLNKSIIIPLNHVPMIQIDCEVEDTKVVFIKRVHIPSSYTNHLFQYYSSPSQTTI